MAGMFARPGGWKLPQYSDIEDEQAAALQEMQARGGQTPGFGGPMAQQPGAMFGGALKHGVGQIDPNMPQPRQEGWRSIVGAIGDGLATAGGGQGVYAPMMMQKRRDDREDQRYKLMAEREERLANKPSAFAQSFSDFQKLTPAEQIEALRFRRSGAPQIVTGSDGAMYDVSAPGMAAPPGPQIGTIEDGYQFMGGDPSNPASWRKQ